MLHVLLVWIAAAAFVAAGLINAIGTPDTRGSFVRWGYPAWWGRLTGGLEMLSAVLIALPGSREAGLLLGAMIVVAAILTVLCHREFSHLAPLGLFAAMLALAEVVS